MSRNSKKVKEANIRYLWAKYTKVEGIPGAKAVSILTGGQ